LKFVQDNIWLFAMALVSGVLFIWPMISKRLSGGRQVSTFEAVQLINRQDAVVVDVREPAEFKVGRVVNSRNVPLGELAAKLKDLEKFKAKPILLLCQSGNRSASASSTLKKAGFADVASLSGGLAAWQQAGMPTEKG
jgi:rhodanese-related sulfurtransferase